MDQKPEAAIRFVRGGPRGENIGITAVGTRGNLDAEGRYEITATIQNSSSKA